MKYLVNEKTKEHEIYHNPEFSLPSFPWYVVDSDSDGWIDWTGGGDCPLPQNSHVEYKCRTDTAYVSRAIADVLRWRHTDSGGDIVAYRPILPAESKPTLENTWDEIKQEAEDDVFTRLSAAVAASESIPALIAEINAMLPEGYQVMKIGIDWAEGCRPESVSTEDMSDWRNWKKGDLVTCIIGEGWSDFAVGGYYEVTYNDGINLHINNMSVGNYGYDFKFDCRPEAK